MKIIKFFLFLFFVFLQIQAFGQSISVRNFFLAPSDLTAQRAKTEVFDQNGDRCALIRVQTTSKGFTFDVGSSGVQKVDDSHVGEIWVYVPYGIQHISIRHRQIGSLINYPIPVSIQKGRTYIMEITSNKVFINSYDDTKKKKLKITVTPINSTIILNGMNVPLDEKGEAEQIVSLGTYTYTAKSNGYYSIEGQVSIEEDNKEIQYLEISDFKPIMGKLALDVYPKTSNIFIDGKAVNGNAFNLQIGKHDIIISSSGYRTEQRSVEIHKDKTLDLEVRLSQTAVYNITSTPSNVRIYISGKNVGITPCSEELTTGVYEIKATKAGYKDFKKRINCNSSSPNINIPMKKIYNYKNEAYIDIGSRIGSFLSCGASLGGYIGNVNIEASYLHDSGNEEVIYWSDGGSVPIECKYSPNNTLIGKIGYGMPVGTKFRITPQVGFIMLRISEKTESTGIHPTDGVSVFSGLCSIRISMAITNHFAVNASPEFSYAIIKTDGYKVLSSTSKKIKNWGEGFNMKFGLTLYL